MVNDIAPSLDQVFKALADPTRRSMIERLSVGPATVSELGAPFEMSAPAVTKHLKVLEKAGLMTRTIDGRIHRCTFNPEAMRAAWGWIEHYRRFWSSKLDALARYLDETAPDPMADPDDPDAADSSGSRPIPPESPTDES